MKPSETAIAMCRAWPELQAGWKPEVGHRTDKGVVTKIRQLSINSPLNLSTIYVNLLGPYRKRDLTYIPSMEAALEMLVTTSKIIMLRKMFVFAMKSNVLLLNKLTWKTFIYAFVNHELYGREWKGGWK